MSTTTSSLDTQIHAFLSRQPYQVDPMGFNEPQVIFRGALALDRLQEQALVDDSFRRIDELQKELGWDAKDKGGSISLSSSLDGFGGVAQNLDAEKMKFFPKRQLWDFIFHQQVGWRREVQAGIYQAGKNLHVPLTRRMVQQMVARAQNHYCGAVPFCHAGPVGLDSAAMPLPQGMNEDDVSTSCNELVQYKLKEAGVRLDLMKGIEIAARHGEAVFKTRHNVISHSYETLARVLIGPVTDADGVTTVGPVMAQDGDYIFEDDQWVETEAGSVLKRDGVTPMPEIGPDSFQELLVRRSITTKSGPETKPIKLGDFMAPQDAPNLQEADTIVHVYEMTAIELVEEFIRRMKASGQWDAEQYPRTLEYLRSAASAKPSNAMQGSQFEHGGTDSQGVMRAEPRVRIAEIYRWYDCHQSGQRDNVMMLLDLDTRQPILYDHVANVFKDGLRPFQSLVWWPIEGRRHGISAVEVFWKIQDLVDLNVCRWDLANSKAGHLDFFDSTACEETQLNPKIDLNTITRLTKRDSNRPANTIFERVPLYEYKGEKLYEFIQFYLQLATNLSGVSNANDASAAGLETSELATGVNNIKASGDEMFAPILANLEPGVQSILEAVLSVTVQNFDATEAYMVEGDKGVLAIRTLQTDGLKALKWHIALEVTSNHGQQDLASAQSAIQIAKDYFMLPPPVQVALAPLYRQQLRALRVRDVDKIIPLPDPALVQAMQQQQAMMPQTAAPTQQQAQPAAAA